MRCLVASSFAPKVATPELKRVTPAMKSSEKSFSSTTANELLHLFHYQHLNELAAGRQFKADFHKLQPFPHTIHSMSATTC